MPFFSRRPSASTDTGLVACVPQSDISTELPRRGMVVITDAIRRAVEIDLNAESFHFPLEEDRIYYTRYPGEHYAFLRALTQHLEPQLVLDIGTYHGASALAMAPGSGQLITYDIVSLDAIGNGYTSLADDYPSVTQRIGDLADADYFASQRDEIANADLVLIDGPKDGHFEYVVVPQLIATMKRDSLLIMDDIRFANMQVLWRSLTKPRIDIGSFAHSSGTGVVFL